MRLNYKKIGKLKSVFNFGKTCNWDRKDSCCCNPEYHEYEQACLEAAKIWIESDSKLPIYPAAAIRCEQCEYANKELGIYSGNASDRVLSRTLRGIIPIPIKGKKKIWLDNVNQKKLDTALLDISPDIEELLISGSPSLSDLSFLEKYEKLRIVHLCWNNKTDKLWDFNKTPNIKFLALSDFNRLSDISQLENAAKLRFLIIDSETGILSSVKPLQKLNSLEYLKIYTKIADGDIRPIIDITGLKYFQYRIDLLDIESYAMFEARRPDVEVDFFNGAQEDWNDEAPNNFWLAGKGQGYVNNNKAKYDKHQAKYTAMKEKYLLEDFVPIIKNLSFNNSPVEGWRQSLAEGVDLHPEKEIAEIEKIVTDHVNRTAASASKGQAKNVLKDTIKKITEFNE